MVSVLATVLAASKGGGDKLVAAMAVICWGLCMRFWKRWRLLVPESLIPRPLHDAIVVHNGQGTWESRPGNAMWCQDSAVDYFDHGIKVHPGMTVMDCGANVGLFAMEVMKRLNNDAKIYCFEPIPSTYALLRLNMSRYPIGENQPITFNCGLSDKAGFATFQFCPDTNIISTSHPETEPLLDVDTMTDFVRSPNAPEVYARHFPILLPPWLVPRCIVRHIVKGLLQGFAMKEDVVCELRTLSEVITSHSIGDIDLLKVDVEGAEELLLGGLAEDQWPKVQAAVVEVHDFDGRLERLQALFKRHGLDQQRVSHESIFVDVSYTFLAGGGEPGHMATLTATRYALGAAKTSKP